MCVVIVDRNQLKICTEQRTNENYSCSAVKINMLT